VFFAASMARIAAEIATEGLSQLVWVGLGPVSSESFPQPAMDFAELMTVGPCAERQQSLAGDAESLLLFTSGTSGASKGVVRTQDMVRDHALVLSVGHLAGNQPPVLVTAAPLYHTSGMLGVLKMTLLGGTLVLLDRVEAREVLVAIEHHAATELMLLPPVVYERLGAAGVDSYDLTSVQTILVSAGRCSVPTAELLFRMFPSARLRFSWGSTEVCSATGEEIDRSAVARDPGLLASVGTANALVEIVLVDDAGEAVPVGTPGEALVRSSMVCSEYLEGPDSVPDAFAPGGVVPYP
jgi:acyl-CoA synthetase (AMP-forming)/AMP-acid ligase II